MPTSAPQQLKRAFIKLIIALALSYTVSIVVNQDSSDTQVLTAFRRVVKRAHPDKGGSTEKVQQLNAAKDAWENSKRQGKALPISFQRPSHRILRKTWGPGLGIVGWPVADVCRDSVCRPAG